MIKITLLLMLSIGGLYAADSMRDAKTGLVWQDTSESVKIKKRKTWDAAKTYCAKLTLAGKSDWRLPSIKELQTIVDNRYHHTNIIKGFKHAAPYSRHWSSSQYVSDDKIAWYVYFGDGETRYAYKTNDFLIRCVRGKQQFF